MRSIHNVNVIRPTISTERDPKMALSRDELLFQYLEEWHEAWRIHSENKDIYRAIEEQLRESEQKELSRMCMGFKVGRLTPGFYRE